MGIQMELEQKNIKAAKAAIKDNTDLEIKLKRERERIAKLKQNVAILNHENKMI